MSFSLECRVIRLAAVSFLIFFGQYGAAQDWEIEGVDCPDRFALRTDRTMLIDAEGHPHIAYGRDHLLYSWYDGVAWNRETADMERLVGGYASIALSQDGQPHIAYTDDLNGTVKYAYRDSDSWHIETLNCPLSSYKYVSIALDLNDQPHIAYLGPDGVNYVFRDAAGWQSEPVPGAHGNCSIAMDGNGYPHIVSRPEVRYSYKDADGWHSESVSFTPHGGGSLVLDDAGTPHVAYSHYINVGGQYPVYLPTDLCYATRDSVSWHSDILFEGMQRGGGRSIALDPQGRPVISFIGDGVSLARMTGTGWHVESVDSLNVSQTCVAVDDDGIIHFTYMADSELRHVRMTQVTTDFETVDISGGTIHIHTSLVLDNAGRPHAAYTDFASNLLKYAYSGPDGWTQETVLSGEYVHHALSIGVDSEDSPHMAFYRGSEGLGYARKSSEGWDIEAPDPDGFDGISMALDDSDNPHISYRSSDLDNLKYAYRDEAGWHIIAVDSAGQTGGSSSMEIDSNGFPHIAYWRAWPDYDLTYAYMNQGGWHIEIIEDLFIHGRGVSLALDDANRPHVGFLTSSTDQRIGYASKEGSEWQVDYLPEECWSWGTISLDIAGSGYPHMTWDGTLDDVDVVVYAMKNDSGWNISVVTAAGSYSSPSLVLRNGGSHLLYTDYDCADLYYAHLQTVSIASTPPVPDAMNILAVWPNPSSGMLNARMSGFSSMLSPELRLFDLAGRLVVEVPTENIPISEDATMAFRLPDGIPDGQYFLSLKIGTHVETVPITVLK